MIVKGPLKVGVVDVPDAGWTLQIDFRDGFRALPLDQQGAGFRSYLTRLSMDTQSMHGSDGHLPGLLLLQQLVEQLLPLVEAGELELHETIRVQVAESSAASLKQLIKAGMS